MDSQPNSKIYIALVGSASMASLDALIMSLDRFKSLLDSDSARANFEITTRSIQPNLNAVHAFVDAVYAVKDPRYAVNMKGRTLIVEIQQSKSDFLDCIHDHDINEILAHVTAVGTMPAQKSAGQKMRDYVSFPVKYVNGKFVK